MILCSFSAAHHKHSAISARNYHNPKDDNSLTTLKHSEITTNQKAKRISFKMSTFKLAFVVATALSGVLANTGVDEGKPDFLVEKQDMSSLLEMLRSNDIEQASRKIEEKVSRRLESQKRIRKHHQMDDFIMKHHQMDGVMKSGQKNENGDAKVSIADFFVISAETK